MNLYIKYMQHCLRLAEQALASGDPPVGAIIVHQQTIIGEGIEAGKSTNDITNHAEILAVKDAISKGYQKLLPESTLYTTHEPCVMCSYVLRHYKIPQIVFGISVDHIGGHTSNLAVLKTDEVPKWGTPPTVIKDICMEECRNLNRRFQEKMQSKKD